MKMLNDTFKIRKVLTRYELIIVHNFIDKFGKPFSICRIWDDYATEKLAEQAIQNENMLMLNCGATNYQIEKGKL